MKNFILIDQTEIWENLLPLTFTRPVADIRVGILKISEKWEKFLGIKPSFKSQAYLQEKFELIKTENNIYISSHFLPDKALADAVLNLENDSSLRINNEVIANRGTGSNIIEYTNTCNSIKLLPDIFVLNGKEIASDFKLITANRSSAEITDKYTAVYNQENIFIEEGVDIKSSVLNAENGFIYLGKNTKISEGSIIQGNFATLENAVINPGSKMRGDTTIGQYCKVGGEISNSVFLGFSNKGHDGFLGNSIIGEWCNLGADTNCSNLKNNYSNVRIWHYAKETFIDTQRQFCGLIMGDHSKTGINTMFNTGTTVGVNANVFGGGFPKKNIPNFAWTNTKEIDIYRLDKAIEVAETMMQRRGESLSQEEKDILTYIFENYK